MENILKGFLSFSIPINILFAFLSFSLEIKNIISFRLRYEFGNAINTYSRLKIHVVLGEIFNFKCVLIELA